MYLLNICYFKLSWLRIKIDLKNGLLGGRFLIIFWKLGVPTNLLDFG